MTILVPATGERFKGELIEDGQGVLLVTEEKSTRYQLAVILKAGWRIVNATPAERAMLEAHGFGRGGRDWWARVVEARTERDDLRPQRVWTLHKGEHAAAIDL